MEKRILCLREICDGWVGRVENIRLPSAPRKSSGASESEERQNSLCSRPSPPLACCAPGKEHKSVLFEENTESKSNEEKSTNGNVLLQKRFSDEMKRNKKDSFFFALRMPRRIPRFSPVQRGSPPT
ncbi:hypothetical protein RUM43_013612 [Polyplax serrata]|uniref:Uncharacterized protein n=1 Tax=Polyplax serrata TaxID=468196 RepID=A0AAN8NR19_POLSC